MSMWGRLGFVAGGSMDRVGVHCYTINVGSELIIWTGGNVTTICGNREAKVWVSIVAQYLMHPGDI